MPHPTPSVRNGKSDTRRSRDFSGAGRGFFAILVLCLIAIGGVAATTITNRNEPSVVIEDTPTTTAAITTKAAPAAATTARSTTTVASATETTATTASALFVLPLSDSVLVPFSEQPIFSETMQEYRAHKAVDFAGEEGEAVFALTNGTVKRVADDALYGGTVTIDHGSGVTSVYCGIAPSVEEGDEVRTGDTVGTLAAIPCETSLGPHLHLELIKDGKAVDPSALLGYS